MTYNEAKQKQLEIHAIVGDRILEEYHQDYIDWLNDEEQKIACEVEKKLFNNEFCICGQHAHDDDGKFMLNTNTKKR